MDFADQTIRVRPAVPADLKQCSALDHNSTTQRVWQLNRREEAGGLTLSLHAVRLPRTMRVLYPRSPEQLWYDWRRWDAFVVAEEDGYIRGYAGLLTRDAGRKGWIRDLVVDREHRRRGTGTRLLNALRELAVERELVQLTIEMQSKNFPAINFCQKHGFQFGGLDEFYYSNRDIALFFVSRLR